MNTPAISIYALDDIGAAMYKRLKGDSDLLQKLRNSIKVKQKLIDAYYDLWMYFEKHEFDDDADSAYAQKLRYEVELSVLERELKEQLAKVAQSCRIRSK